MLRRLQVALIANPYSSGMTPKRERAIVHRLREYADLEIMRTERTGHATELAADAVREDVDLIVVCGGDGTGNEVINGMGLARDTATSRPLFALLPGGATNVLARSLGFPNHPVKAAEQLAIALAGRRCTVANVGRIDERLFLFAAGVGLDGSTVKHIESRRRGRRPSDFAHLAATIGAIADERFVIREKMTISIDETEESLRAGTLFCANTRPFAYLGRLPLDLLPEASLEGGLDILAPPRVSLPFFASYGARALGMSPRRRPTGDGRLQIRSNLRAFTVECDDPLPCQVDGEYIGDRTHIRFTSVERCLRIVH